MLKMDALGCSTIGIDAGLLIPKPKRLAKKLGLLVLSALLSLLPVETASSFSSTDPNSVLGFKLAPPLVGSMLLKAYTGNDPLLAPPTVSLGIGTATGAGALSFGFPKNWNVAFGFAHGAALSFVMTSGGGSVMIEGRRDGSGAPVNGSTDSNANERGPTATTDPFRIVRAKGAGSPSCEVMFAVVARRSEARGASTPVAPGIMTFVLVSRRRRASGWSGTASAVVSSGATLLSTNGLGEVGESSLARAVANGSTQLIPNGDPPAGGDVAAGGGVLGAWGATTTGEDENGSDMLKVCRSDERL